MVLRPLVAAAAAVVLLAGCNGGEDKKSESEPGGGDSSSSAPSTPPTPEIPSFDPPKAFAALTAVAHRRPETEPYSIKPGKAGMVGKTTLYGNKTALNGVWIDGGRSWQVLAKEIESTKTTDFTAPMAVQLDGKEVIATAYVQRVEAGGTQKAHGQVNFQWIDPDDGKVLSTVAVDLTPAIGVGNVGGSLLSQAYDAATGQVAVGLGVSSGDNTAKANNVTVYADPKTKKGGLVPDVRVAGVLNGTVAGAKGDGQEGAKDLSIVVADGASGAIKKNIPVPTMNYLLPISAGGKHAYLESSSYVSGSDGHYISSLYVVDIATGTMAETKLPKSVRREASHTCFSDHVASVVCNRSSTAADGKKVEEIVGFDDTTGKKAWGYTSATGNRVVPRITAIYNGYVYGQAETLPAVLDAKTGQDVPVPAPTPGTGSTPTDGGSPTAGDTPSAGGDETPSTGSTGWGDTSLIYGEPRSPEMVSKYGSTYLLDPGGKAPMGSENILVVQKAIG